MTEDERIAAIRASAARALDAMKDMGIIYISPLTFFRE